MHTEVYNSICMEDTNKKIDELAQIVKVGFDNVGEQISTLRTELKADIARVDIKIDTEISSVHSEIGELRTEMREGFMKTNDKVDLLTVKLADKKVITPSDAKEVMALGPTPAA